MELAAKELDKRVRGFGKDIRDKYLAPGHTTDFGVMFLPVEGLYAEVVRRGTAERLQREYKIVVAGPTTMAALLNSLQMGFKTLAIQKRSSEVWKVLGGVKAEFDTSARRWPRRRTGLNQASSELENLGRRAHPADPAQTAAGDPSARRGGSLRRTEFWVLTSPAILW